MYIYIYMYIHIYTFFFFLIIIVIIAIIVILSLYSYDDDDDDDHYYYYYHYYWPIKAAKRPGGQAVRDPGRLPAWRGGHLSSTITYIYIYIYIHTYTFIYLALVAAPDHILTRLVHPGACEKHSFWANLCHAIPQQKLLHSPWFGAPRAYLPKGLLLRRSVFSQTPVSMTMMYAARRCTLHTS